MAMQDEVAELEKNLNDLRQEVAAKKRANALMALDIPWSSKAKIEAFDRLQKQALEYANLVIASGYDFVDDADHYLFEAVVTETLGKDAFKILNTVSH